MVINSFVESGPYIPKYAYLKESTWELGYKYTCYFKWGGPQVSEQPVQDPQKQGKYDVPDTISKAVQVCDPLKQTCKAMLRAWDYRHGHFGERAVKRMQTQQINAEFIAGPPKRSKLEVPAIAARDFDSQAPRWDPWSDSQTEGTENNQESEEEAETTTLVKQQLKLQLQEQKLLKQKLTKLFKQLIKTQHHLDAPIFPY